MNAELFNEKTKKFLNTEIFDLVGNNPFIHEFHTNLDNLMSRYKIVSEVKKDIVNTTEFIKSYQNEQEWITKILNGELTDSYILENRKTINWKIVLPQLRLSEDMILELWPELCHPDTLDILCETQQFSLKVLKICGKKLNWNIIVKTHYFNEKSLKELKKYIPWNSMIEYNKLTTAFINDNLDLFDINVLVEFKLKDIPVDYVISKIDDIVVVDFKHNDNIYTKLKKLNEYYESGQKNTDLYSSIENNKILEVWKNKFGLGFVHTMLEDEKEREKSKSKISSVVW